MPTPDTLSGWSANLLLTCSNACDDTGTTSPAAVMSPEKVIEALFGLWSIGCGDSTILVPVDLLNFVKVPACWHCCGRLLLPRTCSSACDDTVTMLPAAVISPGNVDGGCWVLLQKPWFTTCGDIVTALPVAVCRPQLMPGSSSLVSYIVVVSGIPTPRWHGTCCNNDLGKSSKYLVAVCLSEANDEILSSVEPVSNSPPSSFLKYGWCSIAHISSINMSSVPPLLSERNSGVSSIDVSSSCPSDFSSSRPSNFSSFSFLCCSNVPLVLMTKSLLHAVSGFRSNNSLKLLSPTETLTIDLIVLLEVMTCCSCSVAHTSCEELLKWLIGANDLLIWSSCSFSFSLPE